jgi:hypothetical protein
LVNGDFVVINLTRCLLCGPSLLPTRCERLKPVRRRSSSHINMTRPCLFSFSPSFECFASHISQHMLSCSHGCYETCLSSFFTRSQLTFGLFCLLSTKSFQMRLCALFQFLSRIHDNPNVITTTLSPAHSITNTIYPIFPVKNTLK